MFQRLVVASSLFLISCGVEETQTTGDRSVSEDANAKVEALELQKPIPVVQYIDHVVRRNGGYVGQNPKCSLGKWGWSSAAGLVTLSLNDNVVTQLNLNDTRTGITYCAKSGDAGVIAWTSFNTDAGLYQFASQAREYFARMLVQPALARRGESLLYARGPLSSQGPVLPVSPRTAYVLTCGSTSAVVLKDQLASLSQAPSSQSSEADLGLLRSILHSQSGDIGNASCFPAFFKALSAIYHSLRDGQQGEVPPQMPSLPGRPSMGGQGNPQMPAAPGRPSMGGPGAPSLPYNPGTGGGGGSGWAVIHKNICDLPVSECSLSHNDCAAEARRKGPDYMCISRKKANKCGVRCGSTGFPAQP